MPRFLPVLVTLSLAVTTARAQLSPGAHEMVKDINSTPVTVTLESQPTGFTTAGNKAYFTAFTPDKGRELWVTNGSVGNATLVRDIYPGTWSGLQTTTEFVALGNLVIFAGTDRFAGEEPWVSDGTHNGTRRLANLYTTTGSSYPSKFTRVGSYVYFAARSPFGGRELYKTDGTPNGTTLVKDIYPGTTGSFPEQLTRAGSLLFFVARTASGWALWRSNGSAAGTFEVRRIGTGSQANKPFKLAAAGTRLFFSCNDGQNGQELWTSSGTGAGTRMVKDIHTTGSSNPANLLGHDFGGSSGARLFFTATEPTRGRELYSSDGTSAGTRRVSDIAPGAASSFPDRLVMAVYPTNQWAVFFAATNSTTGREIWAHTSSGIYQLKDANPGAASSTPDELLWTNNRLYFTAENRFGRELWVSDGSIANTKMVHDLAVGGWSSTPYDLAVVNNRLVFGASSGRSGREPFNHTPSTFWIEQIADLHRIPGRTADAAPTHLHAAVDGVYFGAVDNYYGNEPWRATSSTTGQLADIVLGNGYSDPRDFVSTPLDVFYTANHPSTGREVHMTNQVNGTLTKDAYPGRASSTPSELTALPFGAVWVGAHDYTTTHGYDTEVEYVRRVGTGVGLAHFELNPGPGGSFPRDLTRFGNLAICSAGTSISQNREPYVLSLNPVSSARLKDINPGSASSLPTEFTVCGDYLYFAASSATHGRELWRTDGTPNGTVQVRDIHTTGSSDPRDLTAVGNTLYFSATTAANGRELWKSDGTAAGTVMVRDIIIGANSGTPTRLTASGDVLYFVAWDPANGYELWRSQGAIATTYPLPVSTGTLSTRFGKMAAFGNDQLIFIAQERLTTNSTNPYALYTTSSQPNTITRLRFGSDQTIEFLGPLGARKFMYRDKNDDLLGDEIFITKGPATGQQAVDVWQGTGHGAPTGAVTHRGRVYFAATDRAKGRELFRYNPGAISHAYGMGCGFNRPAPKLESDDPLLGQNMSVRLSRGRANTPYAFSFSIQRPTPQLFDPTAPGCFSYNVLFLGPIVFVTTDAQGRATFPVPVPQQPVYIGAQVDVQALMPVAPFEVSNGLFLQAGTN